MKQLIVFFVLFVLQHQYINTQTLEESLETIFNDSQLMGVSLWVSTNDMSSTIHFGKRDFDV